MRVLLIPLLILILLLQGCSVYGRDTVQKQLPKGSIPRAMNRFALSLYRELRTQPGNFAFSPANIYVSLAMTAAGARSMTAKQMAQVLHAPINSAAFHASMGAQLIAWNKLGRNETLRVVNRIFVQDDFSFSKSFLLVTEEEYRSPLKTVDFERDLEGACKEINQWVEEQTARKIKELIDSGIIKNDTVLVLVNAVYFLGKWINNFESSNTFPEIFYLESGARKEVPMMNQTADFVYRDHKDVQILELPYRGDNISMEILLPKDPKGLAKLEENILEYGLSEWEKKRKSRRVKVAIPKFELEQEFSLSDQLSSMGMPLAFDQNRADLSGISHPTRGRHLFISEVVHKVSLGIDEIGTEATAATAVIVADISDSMGLQEGSVEFRADHPFIFFIRDKKTGIILFMGRVMDPAS